MMKSSRAGPDLGFVKESASAVAEAIITGIDTETFEVIRGGETQTKMMALNRGNPAAIDKRVSDLKPVLAEVPRSDEGENSRRSDTAAFLTRMRSSRIEFGLPYLRQAGLPRLFKRQAVLDTAFLCRR